MNEYTVTASVGGVECWSIRVDAQDGRSACEVVEAKVRQYLATAVCLPGVLVVVRGSTGGVAWRELYR